MEGGSCKEGSTTGKHTKTRAITTDNVCLNLCLVPPFQLVRTCARYHQEQKKSEERAQKQREIHLRHIASTIAREVEFFWSNIEQVDVYLAMFSLYL